MAYMRWKIEFDILSQYNSERSRGLMHTKEWQEKMKSIQDDYDYALHCHIVETDGDCNCKHCQGVL